ncbi:MAG: hypothetical protein QOE64_415 [Frankiales bacterium]|nr:hypothetical protein [Frankiales bacterium]
MRERLADFRAGRRDIGSVISDLEGLLAALEESPQDWRDRFVEAWGVLEIAYAAALDQRTALPTPAEFGVAQALDDLDALVAEVLNDE